MVSLLTTLESPTWAFQRTHYWTRKMQDVGRPAFLAITQQPIVRFQWNFAQETCAKYLRSKYK